MNIDKQTCYLHHTAFSRGYIKKDYDYTSSEYEGKFGKGHIVHRANRIIFPRSNRYHIIEYWINKE